MRVSRRGQRGLRYMALTIGVDVGGTKVAAGVVDERGRIIDKVLRATPSVSPSLTEEVIGEVVADLRGRHTVTAVGLGAAGFVDETRSSVRFAPHLAWRDEPLKQRVQALVGLPVIVENDANASAWGEARFGAGRGQADVVLITVGTGIGAGLVLGGALYRGRWGMAGELGHYRVIPHGRLCACGNRGCWEQYASGSALVAEARELATRSPQETARLLELGGGTPEGIAGPQITQAAREGDPAALRCFGVVGAWLGQGLADVAAVLDPGCFVIGGGVSEAGDLLIEPARTAFEQALTGGQHRPPAKIVLARLGVNAGLVGAADLARDHGGGPPPPGRGRPGDRPRYTTAPLSGPESPGGRSSMRATMVANPPTNAATAHRSAQPGISQPVMAATSRYPGPPKSATQAPLLSGSSGGRGGGGGGTKCSSSPASSLAGGGTGAAGRMTRMWGGAGITPGTGPASAAESSPPVPCLPWSSGPCPGGSPAPGDSGAPGSPPSPDLCGADGSSSRSGQGTAAPSPGGAGAANRATRSCHAASSSSPAPFMLSLTSSHPRPRWLCSRTNSRLPAKIVGASLSRTATW